jgi:hypothetical protein
MLVEGIGDLASTPVMSAGMRMSNRPSRNAIMALSNPLLNASRSAGERYRLALGIALGGGQGDNAGLPFAAFLLFFIAVPQR